LPADPPSNETKDVFYIKTELTGKSPLRRGRRRIRRLLKQLNGASNSARCTVNIKLPTHGTVLL